MSILEFDKVSYQYPSEDFDIIDALSFRVEPGSFHCILGVSGCGKSTIFRLINGLLPAKAGEIRVGGAPIAGRKRYCGYMPQKDLLFPWRTVGENVVLPLEIAGGLSKAQRRQKVEEALFTASVGGGAVKAVCSGKKELTELHISPDVLSPEDAEAVQDMVLSAVNEALRQADDAMTKTMDGIGGGLNLGAFGL